MSIVTNWIGAKEKLTGRSPADFTGGFEIARFLSAALFGRLRLHRSRGNACREIHSKNGGSDGHFVPLFRLEKLAARHPTHSLEILRKRAA